jgi:phage FluMu protein gp41
MNKYVQTERNAAGRLVAKGSLKHGLKIGAEVHQVFEMQEPITGDLLSAERVASIDNPLNFNTALLARQLISIGSFVGPFSSDLLSALRVADFNLLREAQAELSLLGEV